MRPQIFLAAVSTGMLFVWIALALLVGAGVWEAVGRALGKAQRKAASTEAEQITMEARKKAEEIVKAVLFLAETDFVTGECIRVDGGRHLR